nr:transposase [Clostridia bacterium]
MLIKDSSKGKKELAKENIENISKILDLQNCIIIFDGGYPGIDLIWYLEKLKIKYIFRLQTKMYDREKTLMKSENEWINLKVDGDRLKKITDEKIKKELNSPKTLKVRMSNINILTRWLKNILIAVMFADDGNEKEELYNIYQLKKLC